MSDSLAVQGPFGAVGLGGLFSVVKLRKDQKRVEADASPGPGAMQPMPKPAQVIEVKRRKPAGGHLGH